MLLIVNVASECGYTPQYRGLQALYNKYAPAGLEVLGVPCNQFGQQEPGTADQLAAFCSKRYGVTFPMFEKVEVNGRNQCVLYKHLTSQDTNAQFAGPSEVQVGNEVLKADKIFINVGCRALVPPIPGLDRVPYLTNSSMMEVDFLPRHLIVLGGSYIGLEFAQAYRRFGSEVTVIERAPHLVPREDEDISRAIAGILGSEGVDIRVNSMVVEVEL